MLLFLSSDFSNALSKQDLKVLAEMDDQEVVREVQVSWELFYVFFDLLIPFNRIWNIILHSPKQQIYLRTALCGGWCRRVALRNRELHARNDDDNEHTYICWYHSTGSETSPPYAPRSSRFISEPSSVEDDVDVWRYAIVSCTPETTTTTNTHTFVDTIQRDLKHHHLTLPEAADLAQNRPLWRMMSTYGATQSWVARQKRRRRRTHILRMLLFLFTLV